MKSTSVLIVGCGDLGIRTGTRLPEAGWSVIGIRRDIAQLPKGITGHRADYTQPGSLGFVAGLQPDYVLLTLTPVDRSVEGYEAGFHVAMANLLDGLGHHRPRHIIMSSSTRVFAETCGGWVDEDSPLTETDPLAQPIIAAERALLDSGHSASVVRFAGIYGSPGGRLVSRISRGELCSPEPVIYSNRIHREDCAGFLHHLILQKQGGDTPAPLYIGSDDLPASRYEVESWLARKLGVAVSVEVAPAALAGGHNRPGHRRCRNGALHASGYRLEYPDYRSGYSALLESP